MKCTGSEKRGVVIFDTELPEPWPMVLPHPRLPQAGSLAFPLPTLLHKVLGGVWIHDSTEVVLIATRTPAPKSLLFFTYAPEGSLSWPQGSLGTPL